jgi:hypothetical protein
VSGGEAAPAPPNEQTQPRPGRADDDGGSAPALRMQAADDAPYGGDDEDVAVAA